MARLLGLTDVTDLELETRPRWLVADLLPRQSLCLLFGERNAGKSTLAYALAAAVASGQPFFGRAVEQGPVLVCALEGHLGVRYRLIALRTEANGRLVANTLYLSTDTLDFSADGAENLLATIEDLNSRLPSPVHLILIDTLAVAIGAEDENGDGMRAATTAGTQLVGSTGATVLFLHHPGHAAPNRARGHSSLEPACDAIYQVTVKGNTRTVTCTKMKDGRAPEPFCFVPREVILGTDDAGVPITTVVPEPTTQSETTSALGMAKGFLRANLKPGVETPSQPIVDAAAQLRIAERTIRRAAAELCTIQRTSSGSTTWTLVPASCQQPTPSVT